MREIAVTNPLPSRCGLWELQHDHRIAEATSPDVQPRFAQAENAERLRQKLQIPIRAFTTAEPSIARVWDFLLGGRKVTP